MDCTNRLIEVDGRKVTLIVGGAGAPLLFLHGGEPSRSSSPFIKGLAKTFRVYAPVHPGFGQSERPASFDSVTDLVYHYLDVLDVLDLTRVHVVGHSFGGWIAAELAVGQQHRIEKLVLVNAMGIKVGNITMANLFMLPIEQMLSLLYSEPPATPSTQNLADRDALARYAWKRLYNPKLRSRLSRIKRPTLVLRGAEDKLLSEEYGRALATSIPSAEFVSIAGWGHGLPLQGDGKLVATVTSFLNEKARG